MFLQSGFDQSEVIHRLQVQDSVDVCEEEFDRFAGFEQRTGQVESVVVFCGTAKCNVIRLVVERKPKVRTGTGGLLGGREKVCS